MQAFKNLFSRQRKSVWMLLIGILLLHVATAQVFPVDTLMKNGERPNRINLVYLSDGYLSTDLSTYITNATTINNALFNQTPFKEYKPFFNSFAVKVPSNEAGAKHPRTASDESSSGGQPVSTADNYFNSTFDYFSIHRLLVPQNNTRVNSVLANNLPDYDQAFIVVNSPYYGGSGGVYATSSTEASSTEIAIHEIGHSFAQLADEYWAGDSYASEKPNMTQNTNPATVKWRNWYGINSIGIYPYGSSGNPAAWFRPHQLCKMQYLNYPFCAVCRERFIDRIHQLVNMIDTYTPATTSFSLTNSAPVSFAVAHVETLPSTITVRWYLNGSSTPFATGVNSVSIPYANFVVGNNTVRAEVTDNTTLSKTYLPGIGYINNLSWTVYNAGALPVKLSNFSGELINKKDGLLKWTIETSADLAYFEMEKSEDGLNFTKWKKVDKINDQNNFSLLDTDLKNGANYYRVKGFDIDGSHYYSNIIQLKVTIDKLVYKVYQDAAAHQYQLTLAISDLSKISVNITDAAGRRVYNKDLGNVTGNLTQAIDLSAQPAGVYFLTIFIGDKKYNVQLLAK